MENASRVFMSDLVAAAPVTQNQTAMALSDSQIISTLSSTVSAIQFDNWTPSILSTDPLSRAPAVHRSSSRTETLTAPQTSKTAIARLNEP